MDHFAKYCLKVESENEQAVRRANILEEESSISTSRENVDKILLGIGRISSEQFHISMNEKILESFEIIDEFRVTSHHFLKLELKNTSKT